jgi:hypothetical protein
MNRNALDELEAMSDSEYSELYLDLVSFANFRLKFSAVRGVSAEDFVLTVMRKVIDTDSSSHRKWDSEKDPDFKNFLKGCISSEISNHYKSSATKTQKLFSNNNESDDFFEYLSNGQIETDKYEYEELREYLFNMLVEEDEQLADLLYFQEIGFQTTEIASKMGFNRPEDVYNLRKRLRRSVTNYLNKLNTIKGVSNG